MRQMTQQEKAAKRDIIDFIETQGYPTYAQYLSYFDVFFIPTGEEGVAYMFPNEGNIFINRDIKDLPTLSLLLRHEFLHQYLKHQDRFEKILRRNNRLAKDADVSGYITPEKHQISNIAGDWELSKFYTKDRDFSIAKHIKLGDKDLEGLVLELDAPEWVNYTFEQLYAAIEENVEKFKKFLEQTTPQVATTIEELSEQLSKQAGKMQRQAKEMQERAGQLKKQAEDQQSSGNSNSENSEGSADGSARSQASSTNDKTDNQKSAEDLKKEAEELEKQAKELEEKAKAIQEAAEELKKDTEEREAGFSEDSSETQERKDRIKKIDDFFKDQQNEQKLQQEAADKIADELAQREDSLEDRKKQLANDILNKGDKEYYKPIKSLKPIRQFSLDLNKMIAEQVGENDPDDEDTYTRINRATHAIPGIVRPGSRPGQPRKSVPIINVYYDVSGSWSPPEKTLAGDRAINTLRKKYESKGLIKVNLFYVSDKVYSERTAGGMGANGPAIIEHIAATQPDNVIILTDSDPDHYEYRKLSPVTLKGGVFILFCESTAPKFASYLKGRKGNNYYDLPYGGGE